MRIFKILSVCVLMLVLVTGSVVVAEASCSTDAWQAYRQVTAPLHVAFEAGDMSQADYGQALQDALDNYLEALADCNDTVSSG